MTLLRPPCLPRPKRRLERRGKASEHHDYGGLNEALQRVVRGRFANLRVLLGYQWMFPGKKLLFMGGEIGQSGEWNANAEVEWHLLEAGPYHKGVQRLVADLNQLYLAEPGLWQADFDNEGFEWVTLAECDLRFSELSSLAAVASGTCDPLKTECIHHFHERNHESRY